MLTAVLFAFLAQSPTQYPAKILDCHDGDTCTMDLTLPATVPGWNFYVQVVIHEDTRFCGINAPELKTTTLEAAKVSRDYLLSRIRGGKAVEWRIYLKGGKVQRDKYGRLLGWLIVDGVDLNAEMVAKGYAAAYPLECT